MTKNKSHFICAKNQEEKLERGKKIWLRVFWDSLIKPSLDMQFREHILKKKQKIEMLKTDQLER